MTGSKKWKILWTDVDVHVIPMNDTTDHIEDRSCGCVTEVRDHIVIHNSYDLREIKERHRAKN